ncbi:TetR/AcrR family transcriptional regulator [Mycolicibacterium sp. CBMA 226]|uniref:TetR/AcrR family transcriptional regulator n=1 Tax=Mycolicibacterium sp. CBMA 226 TaxID=2606611 RepID=UPI0037CC430F
MSGDEFEFFVGRLLCTTSLGQADRCTPIQRQHSRGPAPHITADVINACVLRLLDSEGMPAVTARRIAAELNISTRTLYKKVRSREEMLRNVVESHCSALTFGPLLEDDGWEAAILDWCTSLHRELLEHPHITGLLAQDDTPAVKWLLGSVVESMINAGFPPSTSLIYCRSLLDLTICDAIRRTRAMSVEVSSVVGIETAQSTSDLGATIRWLIAGVRTDFDQSVGPAVDVDGKRGDRGIKLVDREITRC